MNWYNEAEDRDAVKTGGADMGLIGTPNK